MEKKKVLDALEENFPDKTQDISTYGDDAILIDKDILLDIVKFLKEGPYAFTMLLDLTCGLSRTRRSVSDDLSSVFFVE